MPERTAVIGSATGLHARPAGLLAKAVTASGKAVTLRTAEGKSADARSILAMISLGVAGGSEVVLDAADADDVLLDELAHILESAH